MQEPDNKQEISSSMGTILGDPLESGVSRGGARSVQIRGVGD